jgi:hypothetical protein
MNERELPTNGRTLRAVPGLRPTGMLKWDDSRWLVEFHDDPPVLGDEWVRDRLKDGRPVWVRRADCGAGCRCAGEFRLDPPGSDGYRAERSPWVLDAARISDEVSERLNNGAYWEDEESGAAKAASRLADLPPSELAKRLWELWDTRDDLWYEFRWLESRITDALVAGEEGEK